MAKAIKKIDPKTVAKTDLMKIVIESLEQVGMEILDGKEFGMTSGTIVVRLGDTDVQLKPITPKTGITRYEEMAE